MYCKLVWMAAKCFRYTCCISETRFYTPCKKLTFLNTPMFYYGSTVVTEHHYYYCLFFREKYSRWQNLKAINTATVGPFVVIVNVWVHFVLYYCFPSPNSDPVELLRESFGLITTDYLHYQNRYCENILCKNNVDFQRLVVCGYLKNNTQMNIFLNISFQV